MGTAGIVKWFAGLAKWFPNHARYVESQGRVLALQKEVSQLTADNAALHKQIEDMRERERIAVTLVPAHNAYCMNAG